MFKKLTLQNWKSFRYAELPIDSLTILIGTNASGKSNVVDAFEFLKRVIDQQNINSILNEGNGTIPIRGGAKNIVCQGMNEFSLTLLMQELNQLIECEYTIKVKPLNKPIEYIENKSIFERNENGELKKLPSPVDGIAAQQLSTIALDIEAINRVGQDAYLSNMSHETINAFSLALETYASTRKSFLNSYRKMESIVTEGWNEIFILNFDFRNIGSYSPVSNYLDSHGSNLAGFIASLEPDRKAQLESQLTEYLNHLPELEISKVWVETVGRLNSDAMIYCEEKWGNSGESVILDARSMSDGTLQFLTIMTAILTRPTGSQLIIEEIDNGLHPSRAKFLIELLRDIGADRQVDVLITTHNSALLDALEPDMMPFVIVAHRDQETGESKLTPLDELEDLPKLLASGSLGNLVTRGAIERSISRHDRLTTPANDEVQNDRLNWQTLIW